MPQHWYDTEGMTSGVPCPQRKNNLIAIDCDHREHENIPETLPTSNCPYIRKGCDGCESLPFKGK